MGDILTLYPAYGRRYLSLGAALEDWVAGKDFGSRPSGAPYTSIREKNFIKEQDYTAVVLAWGDCNQHESDPIVL